MQINSINLTDRVAIVTGVHRASGRSSANGSWIPARASSSGT